jgi:hypothetical protein
VIVNDYFAKWVQSYRDLPLLINQWANVVCRRRPATRRANACARRASGSRWTTVRTRRSNGTAMPARRIPGGKEPVALDTLVDLLPSILEEDQALLLTQSRARCESRTSDVSPPAAAAGGDRTVSGRRGRVGAGRRRRAR